MPGSGHRRRGFGLLVFGICGTVLLIWACTQSRNPQFELFLLIGVCTSVPPLTIACINFWQGAQADKLYRDKDSLARWTLSQTDQQANADAVYQGEKSNLGVMLIVGAILIALAFAFKMTAFQGMGWDVFLLFLLGIVALILYIALVIPWLKKRRMQSDSPDVVIGLYGAVLPGQYVLWNKRQLGMVAARLGAVSLVRQGDGDVLIVEYETLARSGYVKQSCRIPVPDGKREEAAQAGRKIAEASGVDFCDETKAP